MTEVGYLAARLKWNWAGRVCRILDELWAAISPRWIPNIGRRLRGRPKKRWRDELDAYKTDWMHVATDKKKWKREG